MLNLIIAQVLLMLVVGLWIGAKFKESPIIRFFGRNDWFVGAFLIIVGYMNFVIYPIQYVKNMNLVLIVIGLLLVLFSLMDLAKK
jgi:hypothetical protein